MNRREVLLGGFSVAAAAFIGDLGATEVSHEHLHHNHTLHNDAITGALSDCIQKGQVCLNHCLDLLEQGNKELAQCAKTVNQVLAVCSALQQLVNQESKLSSKLALIAEEACSICEKECLKHKEHEACKACGDSCSTCAKECKKLSV